MNLIVFDKDGTLTETISGKTFPESPQDQRLKFDVSLLPSDNYYAVCSNQKGVSLGFKSRDFLDEEFAHLEHLTNYYFDCMIACPDNGQTVLIRPESDKKFIHFDRPEMFKENLVLRDLALLMGTFRKPQGGMLKALEQIARWTPEGDRPIERKIFVGDMDSDREAAEDAGFEYWDINDWMIANGIAA